MPVFRLFPEESPTEAELLQMEKIEVIIKRFSFLYISSTTTFSLLTHIEFLLFGQSATYSIPDTINHRRRIGFMKNKVMIKYRSVKFFYLLNYVP